MLGLIGPVDTAVVLIYFAVIVFTGMSLSRKQNSTEEYFLGRRSMHWLMVGISIQASLMSTISYLSVPGEQIKNGLMFHAAQLGVFPAILVINFLLLPYFMRRRITTVYELLERTVLTCGSAWSGRSSSWGSASSGWVWWYTPPPSP